MKTKTFNWYVDPRYLIGYKIIKPFYIEVEYQYLEPCHFVSVLSIKMSPSLMGIANLCSNMANDIEDAAKQNLDKSTSPDPNDLPHGLFAALNLNDNE